jgi:glutathione-regulated potassium-efflux system protein KefB
VLVIGFGRFGQVVSQPLLARGVDISIIDDRRRHDPRRRETSASRSTTATAPASTCCMPRGAAHADAILVCVDGPPRTLPRASRRLAEGDEPR